MKMESDLNQRAIFSDCGKYRYWLRRDLDATNTRPLLWFMINPSIATSNTDDPTTRVACNFALRWGFGIHAAVNGFAAVTPNPKIMMAMDDPVGPENDNYIKQAIQWVDDNNGRIITAWGNPGMYRDRHLAVMDLLKGRKLLRLGVNKNGSPKFPYAIRKDVEPEEWTVECDYHIYGNMATWPRKCMKCGACEADVQFANGLKEIERQLENANNKE